jgi:glycosyltransferase involved in cell wall biosynthesis
MRLLQAISGSPGGGAEHFFMRLAPALEPYVDQHILLRDQSSRKSTLEAHNVSCSSVSFRGSLDILSRIRFTREICKFRPDVVLTWMNRATECCPSSPMGRVFAGKEFLHVARLGGYYKLENYRHCDALIGNTRGLCAYFIENGWPKERVFHIPNFAPIPDSTEKFDRALVDTPKDAPLILALGRYHINKGFDTLLRAFSFVKGDAFLWILGDGPEKEKLISLASELGVNHRVRFLGWQENPTPYFRAADVFAFPSRHEPLGNVLLEAWAHGLPMVATASQGALELIEDGVTGMISPIDDAQAFGKNLQEVLNNKHLQNCLAEEGYKFLVNNFGQEKIAKMYVDLFDHLMTLGRK